jgi:hypothetical protein
MILKIIITWWISLLKPLERFIGEYKILIVKMREDAVVKESEMTSMQATTRKLAWHNYELLCDVGTLLALPCILLLLEFVNSMMKFA